MRIFVAAGVELEGDAELHAHIRSMVDRMRFMFQLLRDAKEAGDFGQIVKMEHHASEYSAWWLDVLPAWGCTASREAIESFVEAERQYIRERTERCIWCWYGPGEPPGELRQAQGSNIWPQTHIRKSFKTTGGRHRWVDLWPINR